jgi:hypothetical protein
MARECIDNYQLFKMMQGVWLRARLCWWVTSCSSPNTRAGAELSVCVAVPARHPHGGNGQGAGHRVAGSNCGLAQEAEYKYRPVKRGSVLAGDYLKLWAKVTLHWLLIINSMSVSELAVHRHLVNDKSWPKVLV